MTTLLEQDLEETVKQLGPDSFMAQQLRNQIHAQTTSKSTKELYITGSGKKEPPPNGS